VLWEYGPEARFQRGIASFARVIMMDQRGVGLSDKMKGLPDLETRMDDVRAVLDAAGSTRTALWGVGVDGGALCAMFAATYPERVVALAFWGGARYAWAPDYPWGTTEEEDAEFRDAIEQGWGQEEHMAEIMRLAGAPAFARNPEAVRWAAKVARNMGAPGDVALFDRMLFEIDFRGILPSIHVPTVVMYRQDPKVEGEANYLASKIPGAKTVVLPAGEDWPPSFGDSQGALRALEEFLDSVKRQEAEFERVLATVLFTDIVGATERAAALGDRAWRDLLERHHAIVRALLERFRGIEVDTAGDGFLARFDGPARAVRCAQALVEAVVPLGIEIRAGLHTGEVELVGDKIGGIAVHTGARVAAKAAPSKVLVSQTVKDLVAGSGLVFEDRGEHELKGIPDLWYLYRAVAP
jgi:class 3 adenylate cyclase